MLPFTLNPKSLAILASCALPITQAGHLSKSPPKRQNPLISTVPAAATSEQLAVQPCKSARSPGRTPTSYRAY